MEIERENLSLFFCSGQFRLLSTNYRSLQLNPPLEEDCFMKSNFVLWEQQIVKGPDKA